MSSLLRKTVDTVPYRHDAILERTDLPICYPSLEWKPGERQLIPRIYGSPHMCTILAVDRKHVKFQGPWGVGMISHRLLSSLSTNVDRQNDHRDSF